MIYLILFYYFMILFEYNNVVILIKFDYLLFELESACEFIYIQGILKSRGIMRVIN
jgi:hypothetical protein